MTAAILRQFFEFSNQLEANNHSVLCGDCRNVIPELVNKSVAVDAIVTDPPYEISFLNADWDGSGIVFQSDTWRHCYDILKPGGYLVAFGGSRTFHRVWCAIEDAGFEVRDTLMWLYSNGLPKSHNVGAILAKRGVDDWTGFGTSLKPSYEPIIMARKPFVGTLADNVIANGVGALNIDACRIEVTDQAAYAANCAGDRGHADNRNRQLPFHMGSGRAHDGGRWPANVVHDGSEEIEEAFSQYGERPGCKSPSAVRLESLYRPNQGAYAKQGPIYPDTGSASRFYYSAKASKREREGSTHPTIKPLKLMQWLVRLVTPPKGTVLDPFAGSGTTGIAALTQGYASVMIEQQSTYVAEIERRIARTLADGATSC